MSKQAIRIIVPASNDPRISELLQGAEIELESAAARIRSHFGLSVNIEKSVCEKVDIPSPVGSEPVFDQVDVPHKGAIPARSGSTTFSGGETPPESGWRS